MQTGFGLLHFHKRKSIYKKFEKYPGKKKSRRIMDYFIYFIAIATPIMTIPQALKIWMNANAAGLSIFAWTTYFIASIAWLTYGIIHKEKPIIICNIMLLILNALIVLGILIYG